jgi:hypothetical protein
VPVEGREGDSTNPAHEAAVRDLQMNTASVKFVCIAADLPLRGGADVQHHRSVATAKSIHMQIRRHAGEAASPSVHRGTVCRNRLPHVHIVRLKPRSVQCASRAKCSSMLNHDIVRLQSLRNELSLTRLVTTDPEPAANLEMI